MSITTLNGERTVETENGTLTGVLQVRVSRRVPLVRIQGNLDWHRVVGGEMAENKSHRDLARMIQKHPMDEPFRLLS